jgi:hypothetical protein
MKNALEYDNYNTRRRRVSKNNNDAISRQTLLAAKS